MKTKTDNYQFNPAKYAFPKKPMYYFHADEDFREDTEWGKDNRSDLSTASLTTSGASQATLSS